MAKKRTLDRRVLRDQAEAAEAIEKDDAAEEVEDDAAEEVEDADAGDEGGDDDDEAPKKKKKPAAKPKVAKPKAAKKPAAPRRSRVKEAPRMKAVWVVFDNGSKRVDTFPFPQKADAEALLARKQEEKKGTFYLQLVKEVMSE